MYYAAHKPENEPVVKPEKFIPWREEKEPTPLELRRKLGFRLIHTVWL